MIDKTPEHFELFDIREWIGQHFTSPRYEWGETQLDIAYTVLLDKDGQPPIDTWRAITAELATLIWPTSPHVITAGHISDEGKEFWIRHFFEGNMFELSELLITTAFENIHHPWHSIVKATEHAEAQWYNTLQARHKGRAEAH